MEAIFIIISALVAPFFLLLIEIPLPFPYVIEELLKAVAIEVIGRQEKKVKHSLTLLVVLTAVAFTLSESILYLINIFLIGNLQIFALRIVLTGLLHVSTMLWLYVWRKKGTVPFIIALLIAMVVHFLFNQHFAH